MMDYNVGDHGPFNKIMLGWITPMVVTTNMTIKINKATTTGEVILVPYKWNHSYFSEYLLIDYYTPDGLYSKHLSDTTSKRYVYSTSGVRIYHVDARTNLTNEGNYKSVFSFDNSDSSHKLIRYITAGTDTILNTGLINSSNLFQTTSDYDWTNFSWYQISTSQSNIIKNITVQSTTSMYCIINIEFL